MVQQVLVPEECRVCGGLPEGGRRCALVQLTARQIRALGFRVPAGRPKPDPKRGWEYHRPVCKGCLRALKKRGMAPLEAQFAWVSTRVGDPEEESR